MTFELRLVEDAPIAGQEINYDAVVPRGIYIAAGEIASGGSSYAEDDGFVSTDALSVQAGAEGATLWRWERVSPELPWAIRNARSKLSLASEVDLAVISDALLIRLDSVAFPPGGTAILHVHQGSGIRCLRDGAIRIDTDGHSASYGPGSPWFELGP